MIINVEKKLSKINKFHDIVEKLKQHSKLECIEPYRGEVSIFNKGNRTITVVINDIVYFQLRYNRIILTEMSGLRNDTSDVWVKMHDIEKIEVLE